MSKSKLAGFFAPLGRAGTAFWVALTLTACGGGGGGAAGYVATISGTASATVSVQDPVVENMLTVQAPDAKPLSFIPPSGLAGAYGDWSVHISGAKATWRYTLNPSRLTAAAAGQAQTEWLQLSSSDGSATQKVQVSILPLRPSTVTEVPEPSYAQSSSEAQVLHYLNGQRARCGMGKLTQDTRIDAAAKAHALRQLANNATGHIESPSDIGFTGIAPADRMRSAGYPLWSFSKAGSGQVHAASEVIGYYPTALASMRALLAAPYHLATAVAQYRDVGIAFETTPAAQRVRSALVLNFGVQSGVAAYQQSMPGSLLTFPCEGSTDLAPGFTESIDWRGGQGAGQGGAPLVVMAPNFESVKVSSAQLSGPDGVPVPVHVLSRDNDPQRMLATDSVALVIPHADLVPDASYSWSVQGMIAGVPFSRSFSFRTGAAVR
jgi:VCBS repeat-containing protein